MDSLLDTFTLVNWSIVQVLLELGELAVLRGVDEGLNIGLHGLRKACKQWVKGGMWLMMIPWL